MSDDDRFPDLIRAKARALQFQGDAAMEARIRGAIAARVMPPGVLDLLSRWFVPVAAAAAAVVLAATLTFFSAADQPVDLQDDAGLIVLAEEAFRVQ